MRDVRDRSSADADDENAARHVEATLEVKRTLRTDRLANRVAIALDDNQVRVGSVVQGFRRSGVLRPFRSPISSAPY